MRFDQFPISNIRMDNVFARKLPPPRKECHEALKADIHEKGILVPLLIAQDGLLLDGHRRLAIAKELAMRVVPVRRLPFPTDGAAKDFQKLDWQTAFAIAVNLHRRHLNEMQRVALGTSLERIEKPAARERQKQAKGRPPGPLITQGHRAPTLTNDDGKVSARIAKQVGVSKKTYERARKVLRSGNKELVGRAMNDEISVAGAVRKLRAAEVMDVAKDDIPDKPGVLKTFEDGAGIFRTIYADPPWQYVDHGTPRGGVRWQYQTMSLEKLEAMGVGTLAHKDGCHLWLWTTWPMIRESAPHRLLEAWGFRWCGEVVWVKPGLGVGRWLRPATEVCILGVRGNLPLLGDSQRGILEAKKGRHSVKPPEMYDILEKLSPAPHIELFARRERDGWIRWGLEA